jgi:hypothetical protein
MPDRDELEQEIQEFILDVCEVMYRRGFPSASVGAIMRLIGVPEAKAREHDHTEFLLDQDFEVLMQSRNQKAPVATPSGVTLH